MKFTELPTACPACGKPFSSYKRPTRKMQKKAFVLFLIGIVFTLVWMVGLAGLAAISPVHLVPQHPLGWVIIAFIILAPGLLIGMLALKIPKVVRIGCRPCGWAETYKLDNRKEADAETPG